MLQSSSELDSISTIVIHYSNGVVQDSFPKLSVELLEYVENESDTWNLESEYQAFSDVLAKVYVNRSKESLIDAQFQEFVYLVSHDMKAPLRNIEQFAKILLKNQDQLTDRNAQALTYIGSGVDLMRQQFDAILEFSQVATKAQELELVQLKTIVEKYKANNSGRLDIDQVGLILEDDIALWFDANQLYQLLVKLIDNSIIFNQHSPKVRIAKIENDSMIGFTVEDNGIGINEQKKKQLIMMFGKDHNVIPHQGIGAGLAIANRIVHRHHGSLEINNASSNHGTIITVLFPKK